MKIFRVACFGKNYIILEEITHSMISSATCSTMINNVEIKLCFERVKEYKIVRRLTRKSAVFRKRLGRPQLLPKNANHQCRKIW